MVRNMNKIKYVLVLLVGLMLLPACAPVAPNPLASQQVEQQFNEFNQQKLIQNQPAPTMERSLERENLIRRATTMNDASKVFYVYLVSYGKVMAFYTAKGKISSVSSYLTSFSQVVRDEKCAADAWGSSNGARSDCYFTMEAPDIDGSYGTNGEGIFFYTTEGAYVETKMDYLISDFPLKLENKPELIKIIEDKK